MRKKIWSMLLAAVIGVAGLAALALGQEAKPDPRQAEVANFNRFLDHHPRIADELAANPTLVNDSDFLGHHPPLKEFLDNHPAVSAEVKKAPGSIAGHDGQYEWTPAKPATGEARRFYQGYLYDHPEVAHQIAANPSLLDSPQFVAAHPGLQDYLNSHPDIRTEMKRHPYAFDAGGRGRALGD